MFAAYNKIKSDLKELPHPVDIRFIKYYQTNFTHERLYADEIYMIDIKSCYASILRNYDLISAFTYDYISTLSKENRLAAMGMLASKKNIFEFDNTGEVFEHKVITSEYSDYFFFCVQETFKIMDYCKTILGKDFLFIWVDAIYFSGNEEKAKYVIEYFEKEHNLKSTFVTLQQFEVELRKDYYRLRFIKDGEATFMDIPTPEQSEKTEMINYLLNIKHNKHETSHSI
jgi:hypothetical protein